MAAARQLRAKIPLKGYCNRKTWKHQANIFKFSSCTFLNIDCNIFQLFFLKSNINEVLEFYRSNRRKILAVTTQLKQLRKESLKKNFFRLSFCNCLSCIVTARIFLLFDLSSAVQIYVSYIYIHLFIFHGYITNSQYDQLPVGLIAQLVEHCTGIAEVMGSNPVQD